ELAQAQRDFLLFTVDAQHDSLDLLVLFEHVGRLGDALGPGKFGDVNQTFDAGFELHKSAIRYQVDNLAFDLGTDGILLFDAVPGVGQLLFEPQADALLFSVDIQDDNIDVLADLEQLGRVSNAAPAHIGNVQQTIDTIQINERAEVGDI